MDEFEFKLNVGSSDIQELITNASVKLMKSPCENQTLKSSLFFLLKQFFHFSHFIFWINSITIRLMQKTSLSNSPRVVEK